MGTICGLAEVAFNRFIKMTKGFNISGFTYKNHRPENDNRYRKISDALGIGN